MRQEENRSVRCQTSSSTISSSSSQKQRSKAGSQVCEEGRETTLKWSLYEYKCFNSIYEIENTLEEGMDGWMKEWMNG